MSCYPDLSVELVSDNYDVLEGESVEVCVEVSGLTEEIVVDVATVELGGEAKGERG